MYQLHTPCRNGDLASHLSSCNARAQLSSLRHVHSYSLAHMLDRIFLPDISVHSVVLNILGDKCNGRWLGHKVRHSRRSILLSIQAPKNLLDKDDRIIFLTTPVCNDNFRIQNGKSECLMHYKHSYTDSPVRTFLVYKFPHHTAYLSSRNDICMYH